MLRYSSTSRYIITRAPSAILARSAAARYLTTTPARYSIFQSAKEKLDELNHKVGEAAAGTMDKVEDLTESVKSKTKEVYEETDGTAEGLHKKVKQHLNVDGEEVLNKAKAKTREVADDLAKNTKEGFEDAKKETKRSYEDAKDEVKRHT